MPNRHLIGQPGSRAALDTPALVIDIKSAIATYLPRDNRVELTVLPEAKQ